MKLAGFVERAELLTVLLGALGNQALKPDTRVEGRLAALRAQKLPAADWPMLQRGGASALTGLNDFLTANPGLPAGTLNKLREIRYSLLLPPLHGVEAASLAHRLGFGNLDVRLRTLREVAAARKRAVPVPKDFLGDAEPLVRETAVTAPWCRCSNSTSRARRMRT